MKLPKFPSRIGEWDDPLPYFPDVEVELGKVKVKTPVADFELKIQSPQERMQEQ